MAYYLLLFLDQKTENKIIPIWEALGRAGVPYPHHALGLRPHITLAEFHNLEVDRASATLDEIASRTSTLNVSFHNLGLFLTPQPVIFLDPTVTYSLLNFQATIVNEYASDHRATLTDGYQIGKWVPHVTLAINFPTERLNDLLDICRHIDLPQDGQLIEIGLIEYSPLRLMKTARFQQN